MPTKDVDSPVLENFKNRKEVYLFSRVHNCRPAEGRELAKWYFAEVLSYRVDLEETSHWVKINSKVCETIFA